MIVRNGTPDVRSAHIAAFAERQTRVHPLISPRIVSPFSQVWNRDPHEKRPRAPDYWEPDEAADIAELAAERDDAAGDDIAA